MGDVTRGGTYEFRCAQRRVRVHVTPNRRVSHSRSITCPVRLIRVRVRVVGLGHDDAATPVDAGRPADRWERIAGFVLGSVRPSGLPVLGTNGRRLRRPSHGVEGGRVGVALGLLRFVLLLLFPLLFLPPIRTYSKFSYSHQAKQLGFYLCTRLFSHSKSSYSHQATHELSITLLH